MTGIAHEILVPATRRDVRALLRRAASVVVAVVAAVATAMIQRVDMLGDGGQLGSDYDTEVGRWTGARV